ncbi:MAG TPA: efflux RND transporter periplasmic adaptor subunit [Terriglobales bacterium]|nr:efflux RND transporter periplasmic adaptor subunit [Terriglobales bacterium]
MSYTPRTFLLFAVALALAGCSREPRTVSAAPETVRAPVLTVQRVDAPDLLEAVGTVRAAQTSQLAAQTMGNIVEIRVHEGDRVQRGQVLAVIDDAQQRAASDHATAAATAAQQEIAAADSDFALADATFKRYKTLYERKSVSPQEFDETKARYEAALARRGMAQAGKAQSDAAVAQARTALEYTRIRAPFEGVITERKMDSGALASPGMPIFTVEDLRHYRLQVDVNESDLQYVHLRQGLPVIIDALDNAQLPGKVVQIVPAVDPASRSFLVKIDLPSDSRLRSGLFGRVQIARGRRSALRIPQTAVVQRGQLQGVYVLDQNKIASLRYVTLGKASGPEVEILAGLQDGEKLVSKPGELELNGKRIEAE